ncbi:nitrate/nitrite transporter, partial [Chloroflexota bacterium]
GVIYSSFFIAYTVLSPVIGLMGDRYNARLLITVFVAILGAGAFLMAYASSIIQASFFFTLAGIGSAACWAPVMALTQRWTSDKHRGKTLAFVDVGSASGIILTSATMPLIVSAYDWMAGWRSLGILGFVVTAICFFMIKSKPDEQSKFNTAGLQQQTREPISVIYKRLLGDKIFWLIGLAYMFTGFSVMIPFTFLSTYASQELSFSFAAAARLITVVGVGGVVGKITLGPLSDKIGRIQVMMMCALLIAVGTAVMAYSHGITLTIFTAIFGLGYGALWSMYAASASDYFSKGAAGSIVGLWTFYLGVGLVISPIIAGWIGDTTGTLSGSFLMAAAGAVVSFLLLVPVWRKITQGDSPVS